jgi:hypothetical protein
MSAGRHEPLGVVERVVGSDRWVAQLPPVNGWSPAPLGPFETASEAVAALAREDAAGRAVAA